MMDGWMDFEEIYFWMSGIVWEGLGDGVGDGDGDGVGDGDGDLLLCRYRCTLDIVLETRYLGT